MVERNFLYIIWKNPQTRRNYIVGKLSKEDAGYSFEYCNEYSNAMESGWKLIQAFPEIKKYESKELFPVFASRLPDRKRRNINDILKKYGLTSFDGYELLKQSGGRLPIDTIEFINPIFDEDKTIERDFYVVGIRHQSGCQGMDCKKRPKLHLNMKMVLRMEPSNQYDSYAVLVETEMGEYLGYIPRYYSKGISERLKKGMTYDCTVIEINDDANCLECVKVKLLMPKR